MRPAKLTAFDSAAEGQRVLQNGAYIENVREPPAVKHFVKFRSQFCRARLFRMQKRGCQYVDMNIPEAGRDHEISAIEL